MGWLTTLAWIFAAIWVVYKIVQGCREIQQARREAKAVVEAAREALGRRYELRPEERP